MSQPPKITRALRSLSTHLHLAPEWKEKSEPAIDSPYYQLFISCRNLANMDVFSLSDPLCALFMHNNSSGMFHELGRTNMLKDTLNPDFPKSLVVNKDKVRNRSLRIVVVDVDTTKADLQNDDIIGSCDWKLDQLINSPNMILRRELTVRNRPFGTVIIQGERMIKNINDTVELTITGKDIAKLDFWTSSDVFIVISRKINRKVWHPIFVTEVIMNTTEPTFSLVKVPLAHWCNGDFQAKILFDVYDFNQRTIFTRSSTRRYIGSFAATTCELLGGNTYKIVKRDGFDHGVKGEVKVQMQIRREKTKEVTPDTSPQPVPTVVFIQEDKNNTGDAATQQPKAPQKLKGLMGKAVNNLKRPTILETRSPPLQEENHPLPTSQPIQPTPTSPLQSESRETQPILPNHHAL